MLYPAIEISGSGIKTDGSDNLVAGLYWLYDPNTPPEKVKSNDIKKRDAKLKTVHKHLPSEQGTPTISILYQLRNYYLHGIARSSDPNKTKEENLISYILPKGIAGAIEDGLYSYWENLTQDDGQQEWINRLAKADIHPFIIPGGADSGLIDPDIIDRILNKKLRPGKSEDVS